MKWNEELSLGNDLLDDEDKEIVRLLNKLLEYRDEQAGVNGKFSRLLSTFRMEVAQHFVDEERLMEQNGCPARKLFDHITDHMMMLFTLSETRYISNERVIHQTLPYLSEKLSTHMRTIDKACMPYLAN